MSSGEEDTRVGAVRPSEDSDLLGQCIAGRYDVRAVLGRGGVGTVYEAVNTTLGKLVAIKVLSHEMERDPVAQARFQLEAKMAGSLGHPNICEVHDLGALDDGRPYIVMERLFGRSLRELLRTAVTVRVPLAMDIVAQLLAGLAMAHARGIVHRDVKPDNVFVGGVSAEDVVVKVLDFGIAKVVLGASDDDDDTYDESGLTVTGHAPGTPKYMAPEQLVGDAISDRTDVYGAGLVLFELLAGSRPFDEQSRLASVNARLTKPAPDVRAYDENVSPELAALVAQMLARAKEDRPTARDARKSLLALLTHGAPPLTHDLEGVLPPPSVRLDQRFRQIAASFGAFTSEFGVALSDGMLSSEESMRLRQQLSELEKWCRHMRSELAFHGASPQVPLSPSRPPPRPGGGRHGM